MDLLKIGAFIAERRKLKGLTQAQLAEKLHVTDRAVSKWECGKSAPDSSNMLELCEILDISVNELLTGEKLDMKDYDKQAELNLIELKKQREESDRRLLLAEILMGIFGTLTFFASIGIGVYLILTNEKLLWLAIVLMAFGFIFFIAMALFSLRIEQKAGYYECQDCGHRHVPTFWQVFFAPHINRSRYMKCPKCGKKSYQKKVLSDKE